MDFGSVLHVAQKNEKLPKKEIKYYSTKFDPPKKEERSKQLSSNIKKFLARKEAEEKQRTVEANARREELLALRSQDKKATRRVSVMLKRTKSANKSVIQDAVDNDNTAVTLAGPSQPDEDDYGYVSQEASAFYNKMMQKYNNMPEDPRFAKSKRSVSANLNGTKDRVRAALLKEQEDALLPHKRKRRPRDDEVPGDAGPEEDDRPQDRYERAGAKPRPKAGAPPPINFSELLKLAEKKQFEPIKIEPKKEVKEEERPMTKRQKREQEKERAWREKKEKAVTNGKEGAARPNADRSMPPPSKVPRVSNGAPSSVGKPAKVPVAEERARNGQRAPPSSQSIPRRSDDKHAGPRRDDRERNLVRKGEPTDRPRSAASNGGPADRRPDASKVSKLRQELEKRREVNRPPAARPASSSQNASRAPPATKATGDRPKGLAKRDVGSVKPRPTADLKPKQFPPADLKPKQFPPADLKPKQFPPTDLKPKQFPPADLKPKQFPPADLRPKQFPPADVRRKQFPPKDVKRKPPMGHKRRIIDDDDSEYDSEMDDFIDDGPGEGEDYSKYISEIFGYDKSRYRNVDEMDDNMESSFSQMMKEEYLSSKIGLMEDLEDMKQEAEDKKRKQERMKKIKK